MTTEGSPSAAKVDFTGLVLGFSSAALYYMGENSLDGRQVSEHNLDLARQNIDIIVLLKEKTKGNLTQDEDHLIQQVLTDLQIKLIEAINKKAAHR